MSIIILPKKLCPKCGKIEIRADIEMCFLCAEKYGSTQNPTDDSKRYTDDNKRYVERDLLPILRTFSDNMLELFLKKEASFDIFGLRLPLLVRCESRCSEEIKDAHGHNRYYAKPYQINEKSYHICSQWWEGERSKSALKMLKDINLNKIK